MPPRPWRPSVGILGLGAFGRLMVTHLAPHVTLHGFDPRLEGDGAALPGIAVASAATVARCDIVVLAVPVDQLDNEGVRRAVMARQEGPRGPGRLVRLRVQRQRPGHTDGLSRHGQGHPAGASGAAVERQQSLSNPLRLRPGALRTAQETR